MCGWLPDITFLASPNSRGLPPRSTVHGYLDLRYNSGRVARSTRRFVQQDHANEACDGHLVGEDASVLSPLFDFSVQPFDRIGGVRLRDRCGKGHVGKYIRLSFVHEGGELGQFGNVWVYLRKNKLANRSNETYNDIVEACCDAWNSLIAAPHRSQPQEVGQSVHDL